MIIITAICFALFFTDIHQLHIKWKLNFKPFNCSSCLAAWVGLVLYFCPVWVVTIMSYMFIAGYLAPIINKLAWKLWK
ncbi:MAG: hypothetical protein D4R41_00630 [Sediminibacterium sp.]|jgi:hypothetical protein|nr:MAG: hypothetical protein D4R41_00630 [Sediminibacterium sp.]